MCVCVCVCVRACVCVCVSVWRLRWTASCLLFGIGLDFLHSLLTMLRTRETIAAKASNVYNILSPV